MKKIKLIVILIVIGIPFLSFTLAGKNGKQEKKIETLEICAGSPVPKGWIITNAARSPSCGSPGDGLRFNANIITKYIDLPINTELEICSGQTIPAGWVIIKSEWCPTCCGAEGGGRRNNIDRIKRVS